MEINTELKNEENKNNENYSMNIFIEFFVIIIFLAILSLVPFLLGDALFKLFGYHFYNIMRSLISIPFIILSVYLCRLILNRFVWIINYNNGKENHQQYNILSKYILSRGLMLFLNTFFGIIFYLTVFSVPFFFISNSDFFGFFPLPFIFILSYSYSIVLFAILPESSKFQVISKRLWYVLNPLYFFPIFKKIDLQFSEYKQEIQIESVKPYNYIANLVANLIIIACILFYSFSYLHHSRSKHYNINQLISLESDIFEKDQIWLFVNDRYLKGISSKQKVGGEEITDFEYDMSSFQVYVNDKKIEPKWMRARINENQGPIGLTGPHGEKSFLNRSDFDKGVNLLVVKFNDRNTQDLYYRFKIYNP
jgi:hypothetical protein